MIVQDIPVLSADGVELMENKCPHLYVHIQEQKECVTAAISISCLGVRSVAFIVYGDFWAMMVWYSFVICFVYVCTGVKKLFLE